MIVGSLLKRRTDLGLTQEQVARLTGISRSYYTQIESGDRAPSFRVAARLAVALDVTLPCLLPWLKGIPRANATGDLPRPNPEAGTTPDTRPAGRVPD